MTCRQMTNRYRLSLPRQRPFRRPRSYYGAVLLAFLVWQLAFPFSFSRAQDLLTFARPLTVRWHYQSDRTVNLTPAVASNHVFLPLAGGALVSLRVDNGHFVWQTETGGEFSAAPVADDRAVYIATEIKAPFNATSPEATGSLRALGRTSGVTLWMRAFPKPLRGALAANRTLIFGGAADGRIYAVRKDTGEVAWVLPYAASFDAAIVISGTRLYIGSEDGVLLALEQTTGRPVWSYRTRGALRGPVAIAGHTVFFGSTDGFVYAVDELTGQLRWQARTGAGVLAIAAAPGGLIVASLDNFVYYFSVSRGERLWKRQLAGRIAAQPLVVGQNALFAPLAGDACVVLHLRDGKQINNLAVGEDNNTTASPVLASDRLLVTTRRGLVAFAPPATNASNLNDVPRATDPMSASHRGNSGSINSCAEPARRERC